MRTNRIVDLSIRTLI